MGAQTSAQRDGKSQEDASAEELTAEVNAISEEDNVIDAKVQQKNGQISISSLNGKADEEADLNNRSEDNTLAEEVDDVSMSQEEAPEAMDSLQAAVAPQVNGEKEENESPDSNITAAEEKEVEEKTGEANEVGFKKIFKFVGFKFTLKKDKTEKTDPVQLLTVKDKDMEGEASDSEETKNDAGTAVEVTSEEQKAAEPETATVEADASEITAEASTPVDAPSDNIKGVEAEAAPDEASVVAEEGAEEKESEDPALAATPPHDQEATQSPFRRFFTQGIFSNLRKKASIKKPKEEDPKEKAAEAGIKEGEETADAVVEEEVSKENEEMEGEAMEVELATTPVEATLEPSPDTEAAESVTDDIKKEVQTEDAVETSKAITDDAKPVDEKVNDAAEEDKSPVEVATEAVLLSSQEKVKTQGSPLKKLFTGAGLKKLSTKKQKKEKKDVEAKLTESGEQGAEQLQSSTEAEFQKPESGASSPEESGEHAIDVEASHEADGEVSSSDEGKKKEGIMHWSSFKKLVTPKKRVKRPSESEDDAAGEKPKSATLSSTESAGILEKEEPEPTEEEPKTETTEKLEGSTEEHKKMKMDTSVSWEALMCMGGNKKRTRKTSDSEDETKIEEEGPPPEEQQDKTAESLIISAGEPEQENTLSSPELATSPTAGESTWDTLKRLVSHRKKPKAEEKTEESGGEQMVSDSEIPKEESSFSLRKLIPGRRKKKQLSSDLGSGEEDSDTPAVVPLSEYYNEQPETKEQAEPELSMETVETEEAASITQAQSSIEERSPSWISATAVVENIQDIPHDQLSDIPEEGAATPKSADTTIAEDIVEQTSEALICQEPEISVAEVSAEMIPATLEETTLLPNEPEPESLEVLQEAVELVSGLPSMTSGEITEVSLEKAASVPELTPQIEFAGSESKNVLMVHDKNEATAICTGLGTNEIEKVEVTTVIPILNPLAEISNALSTELPVEDKVNPKEEADATVDPVFEAQVEQVESTFLDTPLQKTIECIPEQDIAAEGKEPDVEKIATINGSQTEAEIIEAPCMTVNTPKVELIDPITPTVENPISVEIVEVTEAPVVEVKSDVIEVEETAAIEEITAVDEVNEPATQEMVTSLTDTNQTAVSEVCEADIAVVASAEEFVIIKETVCLVSPPFGSMESQQVEVTEATAMECLSVAVAEPAVDDLIQVQVTEVGLTEAQETKEEGVIEGTGLVIAQVVIQSSLKKVSDAEIEPEGPVDATPISEGALPVQAVTTMEQDIENVAEEKTPIAEIPLVQVKALETSTEKLEVPAMDENPPKEVHEAVQVIETFPFTVEVTESIVEKVTKEPEDVKNRVDEIKQKVDLKQALEVTVSDEKVVEETVMEQTEGETDVKAKEEIKEERNVEAEEVQKVPQAHIEEVVQEVQQSEVAAAVLEEIAEVLATEEAEAKSDVAVVTEETRVAEATTEIPEARHQPELIAEFLVPETTQMVIHTAQVVETVKEIQLEEGMEITAIVSMLETKEATAGKDAPSPETTPDTTNAAPAVDDSLETKMKYNIAAIQEPLESTKTAPEEAAAVIHDSQVNSVEEEADVAVATTVTSTAEIIEKKVALVKCAEVMAQVIEVIEEAVKEIEPVSSTELTAAS